MNTKFASRPGDSLRILRSVIQDEGGLRALYRGLWPNMLGSSLGWGLYFLSYGKMKDMLRARHPEQGQYLSSVEVIGASGIAGAYFTPLMTVKLTPIQACSPAPAQTPSGS